MTKKFIKLFFTVTFLFSALIAQSSVLKGKVVDKKDNSPLIGAIVVIANTNNGVVTNETGEFELKLPKEEETLVVSYVSYKQQEVNVGELASDSEVLLIEMEMDESLVLSEVQVVGKKNLENEAALLKEREISVKSIENIGSKEMSLKGLSNVEEGVKKMTGISVASAGQIIVRGLGDRYSLTTLNGQSIASPNPDNKLIPLNVFPSSAVKNITVSKVYDPTVYADYSGAHIDISTKEQSQRRLFEVSLSLNSALNTVGKDYYQMDNVSIFSQSKVSSKAQGFVNNFDNVGFQDYIKTNNPFDTNFDATKNTSLPTFSGSLAWGNSYEIGSQELDLMVSAAASNKQEARFGSVESSIGSVGNITDLFISDEYQTSLDISVLASAGMSLRKSDRIGYTLFYARQASNTFMQREGYSNEQNDLTSLNNISHIYKMITNQLFGKHYLTDKWNLNWSANYANTASNEPDRRQVVYQSNPQGEDYRFLIENDPTSRRFGNLDENELAADINTVYNFGEKDNSLTFGAAYKKKYRDFITTGYNYNVVNLSNEIVSDIYRPSDYITNERIESGIVPISIYAPLSDRYDAGIDVISAYLMADFSFVDKLHVNVGTRFESSAQNVNYYNNGGNERNSELNEDNFFPALNIKYILNDAQQLRFSASKTITRPSFVEIAEFKYQESFGSDIIIGNANLKNAYNYNLDLRYEFVAENNDLFSITGYYKLLDNPIERIQYIEGESTTVQTFENTDKGSAAGLEFEVRKTIFDSFKLGVNGSYMHTNVSLTDGGLYTNKERSLQGASKWLFNADAIYSHKIKEIKSLNLGVLYNYQGPRIHAVGLNGFGDVMQRAVHTLNFVASYALSETCSLKLEITDLLHHKVVYDQQLPNSNESVEVESYKPGMGASIGISLKL